MAIARRRRLPWSGDSPRQTAVFAGVAVAALDAVLLPGHLASLSGRPRALVGQGAGRPRAVMATVAGGSAVLAAAMAAATHWERVPDRRLPHVLAVVASLPMVNALTHNAVSHEIEHTAVTMLSMVAIAAVAHTRLSVLVEAAALVTWTVIVSTEDLGPTRLV